MRNLIAAGHIEGQHLDKHTMAYFLLVNKFMLKPDVLFSINSAEAALESASTALVELAENLKEEADAGDRNARAERVKVVMAGNALSTAIRAVATAHSRISDLREDGENF